MKTSPAWVISTIGVYGIILAMASNQVHAQAGGSPPVPLGVGLISQIYCQPQCNGLPLRIQGRNNCGAASLAMIATANGKARPSEASTNQAYVRHIKALIRADDCGKLAPDDIDKGAGSLGLGLAGAAKNALEMVPLTRNCIPVIAYVGSGFKWDNPKNVDYGTACHIVVVSGFRLDAGGHPIKVLIQDPLNVQSWPPSCSPTTEPDDDNRIAGFDHREFEFSDFDAGVIGCNVAPWKGRGVGGILPGCDGAGGNPGANPPPPGVVFDQITVRISTTCPGQPLEIFYITDCTPVDFRDKFKKSKTLKADGVFHNYTLDFGNREQWSGDINRLRIDLTPRDIDCQVAVSWIGIHSKGGQIAKTWQFPTGTGSGGWWANHLKTSGYCGPFWLMQPFLPPNVTLPSQDPFIENDNVGVAIGR